MNGDILAGILQHHEREDGSGISLWPLTGDRINETAKIIAVADPIYDAMTSNRFYRERACPFEVIGYIEKEHIGTLDHRIASTFLKNIASYCYRRTCDAQQQ